MLGMLQCIRSTLLECFGAVGSNLGRSQSYYVAMASLSIVWWSLTNRWTFSAFLTSARYLGSEMPNDRIIAIRSLKLSYELQAFALSLVVYFLIVFDSCIFGLLRTHEAIISPTIPFSCCLHCILQVLSTRIKSVCGRRVCSGSGHI